MNTLKHAMQRVVVALFAFMMTAMPAMAGQFNVSAAASLKEAINEMADKFSAKHPGTTIVKNFGASGALAGQIENGAPADLFISASTDWIDYLMNRKMLDASSKKDFAYNALVFAGTTPKKVSGMNDLTKLDRIAIGSPKSVPAGDYAMEAMKKAGIDQKLAAKLVMAKDVRECLTYAEMGEVDGSFVYRTDALQAKKAKILFVVPENLHTRVSYPMALTVNGSRNADARAFFAWIQGGEAKSILKKYGFVLK
ncbi:MAG: molybdate ABC transporter substrate-binding protein [Chlorobiaceae bacterium]|nr:molybdate ABC transporter substrate-binding protein [Chlorobiaceae bacterium]